MLRPARFSTSAAFSSERVNAIDILWRSTCFLAFPRLLTCSARVFAITINGMAFISGARSYLQADTALIVSWIWSALVFSLKPFVKTNVTHVTMERSVLMNPEMMKATLLNYYSTSPLLFGHVPLCSMCSNITLYITGIDGLARSLSVRIPDGIWTHDPPWSSWML